MERLKNMKENLISCVQSQINGNLHNVNTKELGEAVDMIKDLEEAIYYCTITKAMEDGAEEKKEHDKYYELETRYNRMYYPYDKGRYENERHMRGRDTEYREESYPVEIRDHREGRSPRMRRSYMESKELHKDAKVKMQELESYMQELTKDIVEMIEGATPEERQMLQQKLSALATKVK